MARTKNDYQATTDNVQTEVELSIKLKTSVNENGETVYFAPVEVKNNEDFQYLGISWNDCKTLHFTGKRRIIRLL